MDFLVGSLARSRARISYLGVLQDGTLTIRAGADDAHVSRVLDGDDHASSERELLPGLAEVQQEGA